MDSTQARQLNTLHVLQTLRREEHISRIDIARSLGLSRPTITFIINDLLHQGIVEESHLAKSTGGRPAIVLRIKDNCRYVMGVDMGSSHITILLCDLNGNQTLLLDVEHEVAQDPHGTLSIVKHVLEKQHDVLQDTLLGLCFAVSSPVDQEGLLDARILPKWKGISIQDFFADKYIPIVIENDANAGAFAELWWNQEVEDFIYVKLGTGIGAGIISKGSMLQGSQGLAGEIGHIPLSNMEQLCRCGQKGCLEAIIGRNAMQSQNFDTHGHSEFVSEHLSAVLIPLVYAINPQKIIIWGDVDQFITKKLQAKIIHKTLWPSMSSIQVHISTLGKNAIALGACSIALHHLFLQPGLIATHTIQH